ncbi:MAG: hypothetical protein KA312_04515 [Sphingorhabdus sp.]|nr:hypothetical protein [Sphingorhabdus sp.]
MKSAFHLHLVILTASIMLAGCGEESASQAGDGASSANRIECALAGSNSFERACSTETMPGEKGKMLVVRHPDGGFRRFNILTDGRGLAPADGFDDTAINLIGGGMIEVSSGDDKYRLPADIKGSARK